MGNRTIAFVVCALALFGVATPSFASNRYLDWLKIFDDKKTDEIGLNLTGYIRFPEATTIRSLVPATPEDAGSFLDQSWHGIGAEGRLGYDLIKFVNLGLGGKYDSLRGRTNETDNLFAKEIYADVSLAFFFLVGDLEFNYGYSQYDYEFLRTDTYYRFTGESQFSSMSIEIPLKNFSITLKREKETFKALPRNDAGSAILEESGSLKIKVFTYSTGIRIWI